MILTVPFQGGDGGYTKSVHHTPEKSSFFHSINSVICEYESTSNLLVPSSVSSFSFCRGQKATVLTDKHRRNQEC